MVDETDWQKGAVASCTESDGFHKVSMAVLDDFREEVSENDLLLLSKEKVYICFNCFNCSFHSDSAYVQYLCSLLFESTIWEKGKYCVSSCCVLNHNPIVSKLKAKLFCCAGKLKCSFRSKCRTTNLILLLPLPQEVFSETFLRNC